MADSQRMRILARVEALLGADTRPTHLTVERSRFRPVQGLEPGDGRQQIYLARESGDDLVSASRDRKVRIRVATQAKPLPGQTVDEAVDPFLTWPVRQLVGDPVLNGRAGPDSLASKVTEGDTVWPDDTEGIVDASVGAAVQEFEIDYETVYDDPETAG